MNSGASMPIVRQRATSRSATRSTPPGSKLWTLQNVILTSHYSGATPRYPERVLEIFLDNLRALDEAGIQITDVTRVAFNNGVR